MLRHLSLRNFRAIETDVHLSICPITLLIGQNSSGKSSILKFLSLLRQSVESEGDSFLEPEGELVHLGAIKHLRNSRSHSSSLRFQLRYDIDGPALIGLVSTRFTKTGRSKPPQVEIRLPTSADPTKEAVLTNEAAKATIRVEMPYAAARPGRQTLDVRLATKARIRKSSPCSGHRFLSFRPHGKSLKQELLETADDDARAEELMAQWVEEIQLNSVRQPLKEILHVSAIREEFQRIAIVSGAARTHVGLRGQHTLHHLARILRTDDERCSFLMRHLRSVAQLHQPAFQEAIHGYLRYWTARDLRTNATAFLADFGFGVSQCLPIIVQAALMRPGQTLLVEQPEAHLHPTAQLEMAQVFADLWTDSQIPSIIETHSSNILLRLRRLVASGKLQPSDVSVAYFHYSRGRVRVSNLTIKENGDLERGLPMEFFGADIAESLEILNARR